jgi:mono/diheme cytochrome c family protein
MRRLEKLGRIWSKAALGRRVLLGFSGIAALLLVVSAVLITTELVAHNDLLTMTSGSKSLNSPILSNSGASNTAQLQRGAYLAKLGNCAACHTARSGAPMAGGLAIHTPFGAVYTSNITPDAATGIGSWSADAFYRAMHEGRSANGRLLTPAFPYANYTLVTRQDSDALYAYFMQGVAPVVQQNKPHELRFPFNTQIALAAWRLVFFNASDSAATPKNAANNDRMTVTLAENSINIERGAYLVKGLGHCSACHAQRNALGATGREQTLSGALMPMQDWYAPSLLSAAEAGVAHWPREQVVALLKTGISASATVAGPMAEVVAKSTQYWSDADLQSAAAYLQSLPSGSKANFQADNAVAQLQSSTATSLGSTQFQRGQALFGQHCASCHGDAGQGMRVEGSVALPALAGNRAVQMHNTTNLVRTILAGGYAPSTAGNPRPFGMPPFVHVLNDEDIAAVVTYIRGAWGNGADSISTTEVITQRKGLMR